MMAAAYTVPPPCVLPVVAQLSPRVWRVMGLNPSPMTLGGTNTYVVGTGASRVLLDAGEGVAGYADALAECLALAQAEAKLAAPVTISDVLISHWHPDHIGGLEQVTRMFPRCRVRKAASAVVPPHPALDAAAPALRHGERIATEGATLEALHTPGHTDDHMCFRLAEERALFTGDCILGYGSSVFASFPPFMRSLELLRDADAARIYPAHGPAHLDGAAAYVRDYIGHRLKREEQVAAAVASICRAASSSAGDGGGGGGGGGGADLASIVRAVYGTALDPTLVVAASGNALHHLKKLGAKGRVRAMLPAGADASILDASRDYHNDVHLARQAAAACSCAPAAQTALLDRVASFRGFVGDAAAATVD